MTDAQLPTTQEDSALRDQARVRRFAKALRVALYDVAQEQAERARGSAGQDVRYFYDADVTIRMIVGFEYHRTIKRPSSQEEEIVRALLASRFLGTMMILPTHAWEVDDGLRREIDFIAEDDIAVFVDRAERYIVKKKISDRLTQLSDDLKAGLSADEVIRSFADMAPKTFVALEAVNGTWKQRLYRYAQWNLLRFDATGWDVPELLEGDAGQRLQEAIGEVRRKPLLNNLRDAAALAALSRMINNPARFGRVRFYTESDSLWKMVDENLGDVASLLSYPPTEDVRKSIFDAECRHIFRDPDYYLVRALFSALRFPGVEVREGTNDMTLGQLSGAAAELEDLLSSNESQERLMRVRLEGKPLSATIEDLESLSFIRSIWQKYKFPTELQDYLSEWTNVWEFIKTKGIVQLIDREIDHIGMEFRGRLNLLRKWSEDLEAIRNAVSDLRTECADSPMPEPMRDLGLVRWGAVLDVQRQRLVKRQIAGLLDSSPAVCEITTQQIASLVYRKSLGGQDTIALCAVLWLLKQFSLIVRVVNDFPSDKDESYAVTLRILSAAAALRGALIIDRAGIESELAAVERSVRARPQDERSRYLLGLAYVHYYAWINAGEGEDARPWAQESFRCAEEATKSLPKKSLSWAFAVNHCVYVGYVTRMLSAARPHRDLLVKLLADRGSGGVWHYRFADTMAVTHLVGAQDRLNLQHRAAPSPAVIEFIQKEVDHAKKYLELAQPAFGDPDIDEHWGEANEVQSTLAALRLDATLE